MNERDYELAKKVRKNQMMLIILLSKNLMKKNIVYEADHFNFNPIKGKKWIKKIKFVILHNKDKKDNIMNNKFIKEHSIF